MWGLFLWPGQDIQTCFSFIYCSNHGSRCVPQYQNIQIKLVTPQNTCAQLIYHHPGRWRKTPRTMKPTFSKPLGIVTSLSLLMDITFLMFLDGLDICMLNEHNFVKMQSRCHNCAVNKLQQLHHIYPGLLFIYIYIYIYMMYMYIYIYIYIYIYKYVLCSMASHRGLRSHTLTKEATNENNCLWMWRLDFYKWEPWRACHSFEPRHVCFCWKIPWSPKVT